MRGWRKYPKKEAGLKKRRLSVIEKNRKSPTERRKSGSVKSVNPQIGKRLRYI